MRYHLILLILLNTLVFEPCAAETQNPAVSPAKPIPKQVTQEGRNRHPLFVSNQNIIYISRARKAHSDPQIYFKNLLTGKEKQITHQRGDLINGIVAHERNTIFFSSTTDEDKETPLVLRQYLDRFPASVKNDHFFHLTFRPQEIYSSHINGSNIKRLTHHSGFDGFPFYNAKEKQIYFSRWKDGQLNFYAQSTAKKLAPWKLLTTAGHDLGLKLSPKKDQFVWFRFSPDFQTSQLLISNLDFKEPHFATLNSGINWSPVWHPNGRSIIFSARNDQMTSFDLFEVSVDGNCQRQISSYPGDEFLPTMSPNGKTILFTSTVSGKEQIHSIPYPEPFTCP